MAYQRVSITFFSKNRGLEQGSLVRVPVVVDHFGGCFTRRRNDRPNQKIGSHCGAYSSLNESQLTQMFGTIQIKLFLLNKLDKISQLSKMLGNNELHRFPYKADRGAKTRQTKMKKHEHGAGMPNTETMSEQAAVSCKLYLGECFVGPGMRVQQKLCQRDRCDLIPVLPR